MPPRKRSTKKQQPTRRPGQVRVTERVFERDFDKIAPAKLVPGVLGRTRWFTERAGARADALSLERWRRGVVQAEGTLSPETLRAQALEDAQSLMAGANRTARAQMLREPCLVDPSGRISAFGGRSTGRGARTGTQGADVTAVCPPVEAKKPGILFIPVDDEAATTLDLETVTVAEVSDLQRPALNETFSYLPQERVIVGRIAQAGQYQAFALPKDPLLRSTIDLMVRHWSWIERDPVLLDLARKRTKSRDVETINRIGQVILDASADDLSQPDTRTRDEPAPFRLDSTLLGDRVRSLLGDLRVVDGLLLRPPWLNWWWWIFFWPCSRWRSIGPFPDASFRGIGRITQLAAHPSDGNVLIAASAGGGVWRTSNGGMSWTACMDLQPTLTMGAVAIAASNPSVMYAASGEDAGQYNPAWSGVGVYRSGDGGATWTLMSPVPSTRFSAIVVHPRRPDTIYVAGNRGLHKSVNGGTTWRTNPGLQSLFDGQVTDVVIGYEEPVIAGGAVDLPIDFPMDLPVDQLALEELVLRFKLPLFTTERVYIGVRGEGVYRSLNAGEQTTTTPAFTRLDRPGQLPSGADAGWPKLTIGRRGAHRSGFLAAKLGPAGSRIFSTVDSGTLWTELAMNVATVDYDEWCSVIAVDPSDENVLYAGAAVPLQRTTNGGATAADWTSINAGVHADQQDLAFDPTNPRTIYLANDGGVYRSTNRGTTWALASGSLAITQFYDIDVSEHDRDIVAGGAQDNGVYYRNAVGTWRHIPWGDGTQIAVDPTDPQIFYFSAQNGLPTYLRRSVDGGASHQQLGQTGLSGSSPWITIIKLDPTDPIANPAANRVLFVCGTNELFRSTNGGQTWQRVNDGTGNAFHPAGTITALEFAPNDPTILYLGTDTGALYRAVNGGATAADWTRIDTPGSPADALFPQSTVQAIRVHPAAPNHVWLVFGGSGVSFTNRPDMILNPLGISHLFRNSDATNINGWRDASGQFPALSLPDVPTSATALADFDALVAFAGTDVGVFRTTDGGVTWTGYQDGLPRSPVVELRFNSRYNRLFAATMGRGVYVRDVW